MNYDSVITSNYFKVKNKEAVAKVLENVGFKVNIDESTDTVRFGEYDVIWDYDDLVALDKKDNEPVLVITDYPLHTEDIATDEDITNALTEAGYTRDEVNFTSLGEYLQDQVLPDEHILVTETGNEGLRYNIGATCLITKKELMTFSCQDAAESYLVRQESIKKIIREFVKENYGQSELDEPSWNIDELAREIHEKL